MQAAPTSRGGALPACEALLLWLLPQLQLAMRLGVCCSGYGCCCGRWAGTACAKRGRLGLLLRVCLPLHQRAAAQHAVLPRRCQGATAAGWLGAAIIRMMLARLAKPLLPACCCCPPLQEVSLEAASTALQGQYLRANKVIDLTQHMAGDSAAPLAAA